MRRNRWLAAALAMLLLLNLLADIAYTIVDPRIDFERRAA